MGILIVVGLSLLVWPGLARKLIRNTAPALSVKLATLVIVLGLALTVSGLLLVASHLYPGGSFPFLGNLCSRLPICFLPGDSASGLPVTIEVLALIAAAAIVVVSLRRCLHCRKTNSAVRVENVIGYHTCMSGYEVIVLPVNRLLAYNVPGRSPQVILSQGLVDSVGASQLPAVVNHEVSHIRHHHNWYMLLASCMDATLGVILPPIRASTSSLRENIERWADAEAIENVGSGTVSIKDMKEAISVAAGIGYDTGKSGTACVPKQRGTSSTKRNSIGHVTDFYPEEVAIRLASIDRLGGSLSMPGIVAFAIAVFAVGAGVLATVCCLHGVLPYVV